MNHIIARIRAKYSFRRKPTQKHVYQIGYLSEERGLYKKMSEQAIYFAVLKGIHRNEAIKSCVFGSINLPSRHGRNRKVEELSKGMQQKYIYCNSYT